MSVVDTISHEYGWSDSAVLDLTVAKANAYIKAIDIRRKGEFRRAISLTEWSTRLLAQVQIATQGGEPSAQREIARESFPWHEDEEPTTETSSVVSVEEDEFAYLETGDLSAAEKNTGKKLPF